MNSKQVKDSIAPSDGIRSHSELQPRRAKTARMQKGDGNPPQTPFLPAFHPDFPPVHYQIHCGYSHTNVLTSVKIQL
jgi:hypothetical protein